MKVRLKGDPLGWLLGFYHNLKGPFHPMVNVLFVFIIYFFFPTHVPLFLPVGAKFQHSRAQPTSLPKPQPSSTLNSSVNVSPVSSGTSAVAPVALPTQTIDPSIVQEIGPIHTRRLSSIIGGLSSPSAISSWWVPRN
jgi:hypothetical protein